MEGEEGAKTNKINDEVTHLHARCVGPACAVLKANWTARVELREGSRRGGGGRDGSGRRAVISDKQRHGHGAAKHFDMSVGIGRARWRSTQQAAREPYLRLIHDMLVLTAAAANDPVSLPTSSRPLYG